MSEQTNIRRQPLIVLIHGFAAHRVTMWPLAMRLKRYGFATTCFGYRSFQLSIESHGQRFREYLENLVASNQWASINILAHSMGGVVTRAALSDACPSAIHRIVMLGAPQRGSPQADWLHRWMPSVKTLRQISWEADSFVNRLPSIHGPETGTVSGSYDWVVPESSGHLEGEADHIRLFSGHNGLLVRPKVVPCVASFFKDGRFDRKYAFQTANGD